MVPDVSFGEGEPGESLASRNSSASLVNGYFLLSRGLHKWFHELRRDRDRAQELAPDEVVESGPLATELVVRSLLGNRAVLHHDDRVGRLQR